MFPREKSHVNFHNRYREQHYGHTELPAGVDASQSFSSAKELAKLTAEWPVSRLVDTWNGFAAEG